MITRFQINGSNFSVNLDNFPVDITLNTFIREHAGLTGTKFMCQEGGCGVCVCVVTGKHPATGEIRTWAVNSCLTFLHTCADWAITTSEGLGNKHDGYHAIQKRLSKLNGTQCGFCSPGFVMNMYGLLRSKGGKVTMQEVENSFGGNICRCTGYRPILDAMKSFAVDSNIEVPPECQGDIEDMATRICPKSGQSCAGHCSSVKRSISYKHPDGTQWFTPMTIDDIFLAFDAIGDNKYMLVAGNTAHGVYRRPHDLKAYIDINNVSDLKQYTISDRSIVLGGNLTLNEVILVFEKAGKLPAFEYCNTLAKHFDLIANVPVRNMGTLAGNLMIKHAHNDFPSDVFITLQTLDAAMIVREHKKDAKKTISLLEFLNISMEKRIIEAIILKPYPSEQFIFDSFKVMSVAQNVHAYVNAGFLLEMQKNNDYVKSARICFGGISEEFVHATDIEEYLIGKKLFNNDVIKKIMSYMSSNLKAESVLPEASPAYKEKLAMGILYKFILSLAPKDIIKPEYISGGTKLMRPVSSGKQTYDTYEGSYPIGMPTEKHEGLRQTSGEIMYTNDIAHQKNQLWVAFVHAKKVGAKVTNVNVDEALKIPGVVGYLSAKDIPGENNVVRLNDYMQLFKEKEPLFETGTIRFYNQPIGIIVAESNQIANRASLLVEICYSATNIAVLPTMKKVLQSDAEDRIYYECKSPLDKLTLNNKFDVKGHGSIEMGLQYHFYMEPQTSIVIPSEAGFEVHSATQWTDLMQGSISKLLNVKSCEVQVKTRRLGGGYGGKATRSLPAGCAAALAAYHFKRPVRFVQSLESMMNCLGKRFPYSGNYSFYVKNNGKIEGLSTKFYQDSGYLGNESTIPLTSIGSVNCYEFKDNFKLDGYRVRTDAPANTACRAPGSLETIASIENIMQHIAFALDCDPLAVRKANIAAGHRMHEMMEYFVMKNDYHKRKQEIKDFNAVNRWRKKGLGVSVMEYRIDYFGQYPITLAAYHTDGSVIISHGGIEMGQGMNTKIAQVTAHDLGIPIDNIKFEASNTVNGANSIVTGGSLGSEVLCYAVRKCCRTLNERLKPVKKLTNSSTWQNLLETAYAQNINLIVSDNFQQNELVSYTVCGLSLTEVEVDILTGNYLLNRVDILEDVGESLNPYVDVGQVEGAFIMGLGYWISEQIVVDETTGEIKTNRTWNYKPPGAKDIPIDFRIEFMPKSRNPAGFMRSKATGEPAICLAVSAAFALQEAILAARKDAGLAKSWIPIKAPITPERIVMLAEADVDEFILN